MQDLPVETLALVLRDSEISARLVCRTFRTVADRVRATIKVRATCPFLPHEDQQVGRLLFRLPALHSMTLFAANLRAVGALAPRSLLSLTSLDVTRVSSVPVPDMPDTQSSLSQHIRSHGEQTFSDDLEPLALWPALTHLRFTSSTIKSIGELRSCTALTRLDLSGCTSLVDITVLSSCDALTHLDLSGTHRPNVKVLARCKSLTHLTAPPHGMTSSVLRSLPMTLMELDVSDCREALTVSMLAAHSNLTRLVGCVGWVDGPYLGRAAQVDRLTACLGVVAQGRDSTSMSHVYDRYTVTDLSALAAYPHMTRLSLTSCNALVDIRGLVECASLTVLDLSYCEILEDISPIAACTALRHGNFTRCHRLVDVSACSRVPYLIFNGCMRLGDVSPLASPGVVLTVDLYGCRGLKGTDALIRVGIQVCGGSL